MYQFSIPKTTSSALEIVVNGGDGHKNSWHYILDDAPAVPVSSQTTAQKTEQQITTQPVVLSSSTQCNSEDFTRLIDTALDRKLAPIHRILAESTDKSPTLQDILGGIGYILGLAGIAAYFQSRKKNQE
jgi:nickel transport protein